MKKRDIRLKILERLNEEGISTEEFIANKFLETLHNDLGTIVRSVTDLLQDGYVKESPPSDIQNIDTTEKKSSKRLLDPNDIPSIRLFITLKGKRFLVETENLKRTSWNLKNDWWIKLVYLMAGAIIGLLISKIK